MFYNPADAPASGTEYSHAKMSVAGLHSHYARVSRESALVPKAPQTRESGLGQKGEGTEADGGAMRRCSVKGCYWPVHARGLCRSHWLLKVPKAEREASRPDAGRTRTSSGR
jgi:hypothetical protein